MPLFDDLWESTADKGVVDFDDRDTHREFNDALSDLYNEAGLDDFDAIPSADDIPEDQWDDWIAFFDYYDLWDDVRDDWEDYEKAA